MTESEPTPMAVKICTVHVDIPTEDTTLELWKDQCLVWNKTECGQIYHHAKPSHPAIRDKTLADLPSFDAIFKHLTEQYAANRRNPLGDFLHHTVTAMETALAHRDGSCIYFAQAGEKIKIGWSKKVATRIAQLQTGNPIAIKLLGTIPGGLTKERQIHAEFAPDRVAGEWFTVTPRLLAYITAITSNNG